MEIIRALGEVPKAARNGDVVLGNFDGVHRGHQAVIGQAAVLAENRNGPLVVVTFDPHPRVFFRPHDEPFDLTTVEQKARLLAALGVDYLVLLPFDKEFSSQPPEDFVDQVLVKGLSAKSVIVGFNFRFGHKRSGDGALLKVFGAAKGFDVTLVDAVASAGGGIYSSTHIREYLIAGKPAQAATLLGRPFEIVGTVSKGDQRGRQLGFPTANLVLSSYVQPAFGGYAVRGGLEVNGKTRWFDAVANIGNRPTLDGKTVLLETHLFDFDEDIYGREFRVALIEFLRPEQKFDGIEALKERIEIDSAIARRMLKIRAAGAS
ncbi:bifunctional riboflavin kinase/FAD synthetase [Alphaproteobacteria bacterium]|jgi:riboflavin kinase/FMN adenylyltransferase|nr:bifunctional riboflavin kinase/FAD synthetase [Alphaproteobacteria bacterium]